MDGYTGKAWGVYMYICLGCNFVISLCCVAVRSMFNFPYSAALLNMVQIIPGWLDIP